MLTYEQLDTFAGNMLELQTANGERLTVMSSRARASLTDDQVSKIEQHSTIVDTDISTIEDSSGGSARCMLAEIHLPQS